ncbi:hypothetical protein CCHL11_10172 [Colletotrichum chlorophyti]|uniref:Uncharacterized protein n=1 Tax=Colletotrichum chlorophyti TaxID=708187 RepID=A0A1Q8S8J5_9PEZI|nr:hypothetical protein CCHL11_10172 [Colletotrichum chlorophyti]
MIPPLPVSEHQPQEIRKEVKTKVERLIATKIGGTNGVATLIWGGSRYYDISTVNGDMMCKFSKCYEFADVKLADFLRTSVAPSLRWCRSTCAPRLLNKLLPVTLFCGTGNNVIPAATQTNETLAGIAIRDDLLPWAQPLAPPAGQFPERSCARSGIQRQTRWFGVSGVSLFSRSSWYCFNGQQGPYREFWRCWQRRGRVPRQELWC